MNICMVLAGVVFPPDIRVEKEARSLVAAGNRVVILCDGLPGMAAEDEWESCRIVRVPRPSGLALRIRSLSHMLTFRSGTWYRAISTVVRRERIDVLHVHDLPMLGTGLAVGKRFGIPVIADLHENYPAAISYYNEGRGLRRIAAPLFARERWERYERRCVQAADRVLVVVDEAKDRLVRTGISADKITVLENTEDLEHFGSMPIDDEIIQRYGGEFVITYVGGLGGRHRGLPTVIKAMPRVREQIPFARLLLVGDGPIRSELEGMVRDLGLNDCVEFVPWQPLKRVPSFIALSTVCIVPHQENAHTNATVPHKLFQYMVFGKPVVVSTCKPLRRIVEQTGAGLVFRADDADDLAAVLARLRDDKLRAELGRRGQEAVRTWYNWKRTAQDLLSVYATLEPRPVPIHVGDGR
mgnify:CR=1 FL=1